MSITTFDVLRALDRAVAPRSACVADVLDRNHREHVARGGTGFPPRRSLILARLRTLEASGLIVCTGGPDGYYGYGWRITEAGRASLSSNVRGGQE